VSFEDIASIIQKTIIYNNYKKGFYCEEDYDTLISILDFMNSASEKLEEIYSRKVFWNNSLSKIRIFSMRTSYKI